MQSPHIADNAKEGIVATPGIEVGDGAELTDACVGAHVASSLRNKMKGRGRPDCDSVRLSHGRRLSHHNGCPIRVYCYFRVGKSVVHTAAIASHQRHVVKFITDDTHYADEQKAAACPQLSQRRHGRLRCLCDTLTLIFTRAMLTFVVQARFRKLFCTLRMTAGPGVTPLIGHGETCAVCNS